MKNVPSYISAAVLGLIFPLQSQEMPPAGSGLPLPPPTPNETTTEEGDESEQAQDIDMVRRSNFILSKIRDNDRAIDPFGMLMDPANPLPVTEVADQNDEVEEQIQPLNSSSLKKALESLPITGSYPQKQMVVIGARTLLPGSQFGMIFEGLTIRLRFEGIKGQSLYFTDMDTEEVTFIDFNPLPKEFERMTKMAEPRPSQGIVPMSDLFIVD